VAFAAALAFAAPLAGQAVQGGPLPDTEEGRTFAQVFREVADIDRETVRSLQERAERVGDEVRKLRAGKKWRESCVR